MQKKSILVVGSANVDMVVKTPRIPSPGETILGGVFQKFEGGKGANQAVAANAAFGGTRFCAGVGDDSFGRDYLSSLGARGINVELVKIFKDFPTGVALITVDESGQNSITVAPGANMALSEGDMDSIDFSAFSHVLFQLENDILTVARGLNLAKKAGCETILTPAPAKILPRDMLRDIDYIVPNEIEILQIVPDCRDAEDAAQKLISSGVKNVIVTLGKRGCDLYNGCGIKHFPTYENIRPVDTVGAGDCFTGSLAGGLKICKNLERAIEFATAAASLKISKMGAQSVATLEEVKKLAAQYPSR
ncbi:MAG TPA: ribokinase [Candidatus Merdousia gallistercoris]|nr:ribokinase [Candidatus Merdousia gallistercoris]